MREHSRHERLACRKTSADYPNRGLDGHDDVEDGAFVERVVTIDVHKSVKDAADAGDADYDAQGKHSD